MNYTFLLSVCDLSLPLLLLGMLIPALLGYLIRHFMGAKSNTSVTADAGLDWSAKYAKLEADYNGLQSKFNSTSNSIANAGNLEGQLKKLKDQLGSYEGDMSKLRAELKASNVKLAEFEGVDLMALKHKISGLEGERIKLQNSLQEITGSATEAQDAAAQATALKTRLDSLEMQNAKLIADYNKVTNEKNNIVRSEESLAQYKEDVRNLSGKVGALTVENEKLKAELATSSNLTSTNVDLQNQLSAAQNDDAAAAEAKAAYEAKIATLTASLNEATSKANAATQLDADLKAANEKLKTTEIDLSSARLKLETQAAPTTIEKIVEVEKVVEVSSKADAAKIAELETALAAAKSAAPTTIEKIVEVEKPVEKIVEKIVEVEKVVEVSSKADAAKIAELETALAAAATTVKAAIVPDDLLVIEGIGPKVNELFKAQGVETYAALADMSKEQVAAVLETGGARFQMLNGNSWPKQAALLRDGKTEEFNAYCDYLIAGVDPNEAKVAAADVIPDDLKIVEGIGPKIEQLLNADGIFTFAQLADSSYSQLKEILENAGSRFQMHDPTTWPTQSALARDGKMDELQKMQDELKGGK
jgi:predicted flap endonuclease-1-like 5' DNA nuclease